MLGGRRSRPDADLLVSEACRLEGFDQCTSEFLRNFLSGLSTLLGAVVAFYLDVGSEMEGSVLAVGQENDAVEIAFGTPDQCSWHSCLMCLSGAGIFIYVAATELGPSVSRLRSEHSQWPVLGSVPCRDCKEHMQRH